jgi:hypothetical protein
MTFLFFLDIYPTSHLFSLFTSENGVRRLFLTLSFTPNMALVPSLWQLKRLSLNASQPDRCKCASMVQ